MKKIARSIFSGALLLTLTSLFLFGCASIREKEQNYERDKKKSMEAIQETDSFITETKPQEVSWVRFNQPFHWEYLNNQFVIIETRKGKHLIRVRNYCPKLDSIQYTSIQYTSIPYTSDLTDYRTSMGMLKVNSDTIRGCVIDAIYTLPGDAEPGGAEPGDGESGAEQ